MSESMEAIEKVVDRILNELGEHTTSARVFVTLPSSDGRGRTLSYTKGAGCYYSAYGAIHEWMIHQDETARAAAREEAKGE